MDTSVLLSGEQLLLLKLNYKTKKKMRPRQSSFSTKIISLPDNSAAMDSLANRVQTELNNKFAVLKEPRVRSASEMGLAVWCPQTKSAVVICDKKRQPWMGYTENNQLRYTPEETLFLMETESIIVNYMELPLSLQTAYQLMLTDEYLFKCYKVYAYLTRLGYKLKPFPQSNQARSLSPNISSTTFITNKTVEPIIKSNCALRLVMMPLRRDMFLRGTSFDRCANWAEYKRSTTPREPGVIFAEEATVLELNEEIRNERNIFDQLPNKSLIDYSNNLQPLIDQTKVTDINKIRVGAVGAAKKESSESSTHPEPQQSPSPSPVPPSPASSQPSSPPPAPPKPTAPASSTPVFSFTPPTPVTEVPGVLGPNRAEHRVKINRMRQRIAQRLKDAQNTYAMLTTFNEIDMSNAIELRNSYKDAFLKKHNLKLGFMSAFVKATAYALLDQPIVNAVIDDQDIVYRDYIDISVAVATPKGLVVPVLRNVENMNYAQIEQAIADMGEKARTNNLAIEDMDGGTFTISNGGVFGSLFGTPIINPPQSAILGMHGIVERPVAVKGKVEIRPMMYVALTYDHRIIDGREAVTFLRKIKSTVEDPRLMLLDL